MVDIIKNIRRQPESLRQIRAFLTTEGAADLESAAAFLRNRRVIFTGMGGSLYALMPAATWLADCDILANVIDAGELLYYGALPRNSTLVALSRSGRTAETVRVAATLKSAGVPLVGVTNFPDSPLGAASDSVLRVAGDVDQGVSIQTYTGGILTGLYLVAALTGRLSELDSEVERAIDFADSHMEGWEREAAGWDLRAYNHFFFLGRGYSVSSASEACLLIQELGRRTATCYNAAEFRQGPVEALRRGHAVIVFAPDGRTGRLNRSLANDLGRTGAKVLVLGDSLPIPEYLAPLLQIISVQLAVFYLAAAEQQTPGEFRYAAAISEHEDGLAAE